MKDSIGTKVLKGAGIVSLFTLLGKVMVFVQKLVIAHQFGTGIEADAFTLAFNSIIFAFCIIPLKLLAPFLPLFVERKEKQGEQKAWEFTSSVATISAIILVAVVAGGIVAAPWLVQGVSRFQTPEASALSVSLVRIMFPAVLLLGLFALVTLIMHAYKRFALPAIGETLSRITAIVVLLLLFREFRVKALAIGVVAGALVCLSLQLWALRRELRWLRPRIDWRDPGLVQLAKLVPPVIVAILIAQGRTILDFWFASGMGPGYTASLGYAKGITDTLSMIVPFAIGVVIYPFFSDLIAEGNRDGFTNTLMGSLRLMAFLFVPLSVLLMVLRTPIVQLAFQRGHFDMNSVNLTTGPLLFYALGMSAFALEIIIMRSYFALKDTWTPAWVGVICVAIHVAFILAFKGVMEHSSIPLAATLSKSAKVLILFVLLKPHLTSLRIQENLRFLLKSVAAGAGMAVAVYATYKLAVYGLPLPIGVGKTATALYLAGWLTLASSVGLATFAGLVILLRMQEATLILNFARGFIRKRQAKA